MKFNNFVKEFLGLICLSSFVFANDCDEIKTYLKENQKDVDKIIGNCIVNEEGNVTSLTIDDKIYIKGSLAQEDFNKLFSYKTIQKLEYNQIQEFTYDEYYDGENYIDYYDEKRDLYYCTYCNVPYPDLPDLDLSGLTNLTDLNINCHNYRYDYGAHSYDISYYKGNTKNTILKLPNSLRNVSVERLNMSQNFINTFGKLPNLDD
eukprot:jgi/Orpsp1_1/1176334/evm.model.c7180000057220.1